MKATVRNPAIFGPGLRVKSHDTFHAANTRMPYRIMPRTLLCERSCTNCGTKFLFGGTGQVRISEKLSENRGIRSIK